LLNVDNDENVFVAQIERALRGKGRRPPENTPARSYVMKLLAAVIRNILNKN